MGFTALIQIPVADVERAVSFYQTVLGRDLNVEKADETRSVVMLSGEDEMPQTMLLNSPGFDPNAGGTLAYIGVEDLDTTLARVKEAGGEITFDKFGSEERGYIANFRDSEGNTVGLASKK